MKRVWSERKKQALEEFHQSNSPIAQFQRDALALLAKKKTECEEEVLHELRTRGPAALSYTHCYFFIPLPVPGWKAQPNKDAQQILEHLDPDLTVESFMCKDDASVRDWKSRHRYYSDDYCVQKGGVDGWKLRLTLLSRT